MDHPVELTVAEQLEDLIDDLDGRAQGIARKVISEDGDISGLSDKQLRVWNQVIWPALRRQAQKRDAGWRRELMERAG